MNDEMTDKAIELLKREMVKLSALFAKRIAEAHTPREQAEVTASFMETVIIRGYNIGVQQCLATARMVAVEMTENLK